MFGRCPAFSVAIIVTKPRSLLSLTVSPSSIPKPFASSGFKTYDGIRLELFHVLDIPPLHMSARSQVVGAYAERMLCARGTVNVRFQSGFPVQEGLVLRLIDFLANVVRRNDLLLIESGALGGRGERTAFEGNVRLPRQEARRFLFFQFLERDPPNRVRHRYRAKA